ncbi:unnamed protein product [Rhodiola kirilowii]
MVLSIIQNSLEASILEAYSYCETAKDLWDTLQTVYGNTSNLSRVFEVKKAINNLCQEDMEFTQHFGKFRSLWAELEMLRPSTIDPATINERREQDKVFGLLLTLNPTYNDLIKHILRADKLPTLEEMCAQIQKEQGSLGLFGGKGELSMANKAEAAQANKVVYKSEERKVFTCEFCKKKGHMKDKCWILHPHLKPNKFKDAKAHLSNEEEGQALTALKSTEDGMIRRSDLDALIKALKENLGNTLGKSFIASNISKSLIIDSGASHHMISNSKLINDVEPALGNVVIANGDKIPIKGVGNLNLFDKKSRAFYMPSFTSNLLSVKKVATDLDCNVIFSPNDVKFQDIKSHQLLGKGVTKEGLYLLDDTKPLSDLNCAFSSYLANDTMWHARLGHPHARALNLMLPSVSFKNDDCEACILGKHCKSVFPKSITTYRNCFDLVHSDVWTAPCMSRENHKYFVTFIDEKSKYTWLTLIQSKDRVLEAFMNFQNYITNQFNAKIKVFRSDNGGEYTSNTFKQHLANHGIIHQTSCPYTPQQNGVAERKNRNLMEIARSMMFHTNVPKRFWGDAVMTASYLINRIPTRSLDDISPYEVLNKSKPSINHLRVFGCLCFVLIPGEQRNKLEAKSTKAMFIGYSTTQKGYKCYDPVARNVLVSRDVKFVEAKGYYESRSWDDLKNLSQVPSDRATNLRFILEGFGLNLPKDQGGTREVPAPMTPQETEELPHPDHEGGNQDEAQVEPQEADSSSHDQDGDQDEAQVEPQEASSSSHNQDGAHDDSDFSPNDEEHQGKELEEVQPLRRSTRVRNDRSNWVNTRVFYNNMAVAHPIQAMCFLAHFPQEHQVFISKLDEGHVPRSYDEAKEHKLWREAICDETKAMEVNDTWYESDLPKGKKAVSMAKLHTVRIILSLATNLEWELWQMDVKNAFLQGELEEEVYMLPPPGLEDSVKPGKVLRLKKAIYGLKQSPRAWYHKLSSTLIKRGFKRSEADHTLFNLCGPKGRVVILVYVDDIIITGSDKAGINATKVFLKSVFDIKDLGKLKYFLGIEVCQSKEGLFLSQRKYTLDLLCEAGKLGAKPANTPLEEGYKVSREGEIEDRPFEDFKQYRRMVGKLIYLTISRPDICFAVNQVSQHMQAPKMHHWHMVERVLRYLKGSPGQGIWMGCNGSTEIVGYCDADWAGDRVDRKSTTGFCTFIGGNLVTWKSKKQKVISCSSAEAEYRAMRKLTNELIWIKALLKDLGIESPTPITMHCDNQAAIHIASNSVFHERTKHIEVDCHKVRQMVEQRVILPCYTRSGDQLADIFTKAASSKVCKFIHSKLGLTSIPLS